MVFKKLVWQDAYTVNDQELDAHHKQLVDIGNRIIDFVNANREDTEELMMLLTELDNHILYHFDTEEKYLQDLDFPEVKEHIKAHDTYRREMKDFINEMWEMRKTCKSADDCRTLGERAAMFVTEWATKHMMGNAGTEKFFAMKRRQSEKKSS